MEIVDSNNQLDVAAPLMSPVGWEGGDGATVSEDGGIGLFGDTLPLAQVSYCLS